jgi:hypothetical protein
MRQPTEAPSTAYEYCDLNLRLVSEGGFFSSAKWIVEAQQMGPSGLRLIAGVTYKTETAVVQYQGADQGFVAARNQLCERLLREGWQEAGGGSVIGGMSLPRFRRPISGGGAVVPAGSDGSGQKGFGISEGEALGRRGTVSTIREWIEPCPLRVATPAIQEYMRESPLWTIVRDMPGVIEARDALPGMLDMYKSHAWQHPRAEVRFRSPGSDRPHETQLTVTVWFDEGTEADHRTACDSHANSLEHSLHVTLGLPVLLWERSQEQ